MDMDVSQNGPILWNILMAVIATSASIIAFFAKSHLEKQVKEFEELKGDQKILTQRLWEMAVKQKETEPLGYSISEIKAEIKELRSDIQDLHVAVSKQNNISNIRR